MHKRFTKTFYFIVAKNSFEILINFFFNKNNSKKQNQLLWVLIGILVKKETEHKTENDTVTEQKLLNINLFLIKITQKIKSTIMGFIRFRVKKFSTENEKYLKISDIKNQNFLNKNNSKNQNQLLWFFN